MTQAVEPVLSAGALLPCPNPWCDADRFGAVPPGSRLVPEVPTEAMLAAGAREADANWGSWQQEATAIWSAMLTAATVPPRADVGEVERLREAVAWYGEQARLARLIHTEGNAGRHALAADGGKRARQVLEYCLPQAFHTDDTNEAAADEFFAAADARRAALRPSTPSGEDEA